LLGLLGVVSKELCYFFGNFWPSQISGTALDEQLYSEKPVTGIGISGHALEKLLIWKRGEIYTRRVTCYVYDPWLYIVSF
jgi:hypothetical protein